jgi:tight adherence protein B
MSAQITLLAAKYGAVFLIFISLVFIGWAAIGDKESLLMRNWARYCAFLERKLRLMFNWTPGSRIAIGQLIGVAVVLALHMAIDLELFVWVFLLAICAGPAWYIERLRQQRVAQIEDQLDGFLTALANSLKATPSVANSFMSIQPLLPEPTRSEVELACKEMKVGSTLEQALLNIGGRVGSRQFDTALSAILIGRQLGGDLPKILETTAHTMREMVRLEGVVKTKTAEGKVQAMVLACFPFIFAIVLNWMQPGFYDPLKEPIMGWVIAGVAGACWLASVLLARKVLQVDI